MLLNMINPTTPTTDTSFYLYWITKTINKGLMISRLHIDRGGWCGLWGVGVVGGV